MSNFSQQFVIIYDYFKSKAEESQKPSSKLDLARLLGVSQGQMQNWEKGQRPNALACLAIHKKLGFEFEWLVTGQGPVHMDDGGDYQKPIMPSLERENAALRELLASKDEIIALQKQLLAQATAQAGQVPRDTESDSGLSASTASAHGMHSAAPLSHQGTK